MKDRKKRSKRMRVLNLWTQNDAAKAVPYLRSVTGSLREHWLDVLQAEQALRRAEDTKSPAKRATIIEQEKRRDERQRAQTKFDDALEELNRVDVFLLDPVQGLSLIPFRKQDDLAWFVFDHFASSGLVGWRHHADPIEECRPLDALEELAVKDALAP